MTESTIHEQQTGNHAGIRSDHTSLEDRLAFLESQIALLNAQRREQPPVDAGAAAGLKKGGSLCLVVFSGSLDRLLAAMNIATGAAAMGSEVTVFFTFWGTAALRKGAFRGARPFIERMFGWMLPSGAGGLKLSTMNWGGLGTGMIKRRMKKKNVSDLAALFGMARELGVRFIVCEMSMDLMGMKFDDLIDYPAMDRAGVGAFMGRAMESDVTLFI
jgi:peroxiredoxin family protein